MRVLIIEDRQALAEEYLRIFAHLLEGEYDYTHVPSIEASLKPLSEENWDVIFVDNELGQGAVFPEGSDEEDGLKLSSGYDLVKFRRSIEEDSPVIATSHIVGIAANQVALTFFKDIGADDSILKLYIPHMAEAIRNVTAEKA
jgi:hypothetical protein